MINRWTRIKRNRKIHRWIREIQTGSRRKGKGENVSEKAQDPGGHSQRMKWGGGDGKLCVYVLQEEALQAGGNTRASISNVCLNKCVYVCVMCTIVTGGVYFGSVHQLTAKTNPAGWIEAVSKVNIEKP